MEQLNVHTKYCEHMYVIFIERLYNKLIYWSTLCNGSINNNFLKKKYLYF